jgi:enediyne biosynthesis protein E4
MSYLPRAVLMAVVIGAGSWWLAPRQAEDIGPDAHFEERAAQAGCLNVHTKVVLSEEFNNIMPWLSSVGAAAAAADYDGDSFPDVYVTNSGRNDHNHLFRNRGDGTFEDVTAAAGVACTNVQGGCMHAIWGDINNDGHLDLYVVKWGEASTLYLNRGDGTFTNVSRQAGVDCWGYFNAATFLDYDRDGLLDILVCGYFAEEVKDPQTGKMVRNDLWHPVTTRVMHETFTHAQNGGHKKLFRNRGDGTFEDVTKKVGLNNSTYWTLAVGAGDLNNDGWPDVYVANDFGPDEVYLNTGATENPPRFRRFVDPRGHPGIGNDWWKGMNVDMADVNNDGYLDIYVSNVFERRYKTDEGNMLWLNCADVVCPGGRGFRNIAKTSGTMDGGWGWGCKFADFNNDGLLDIIALNGFVTGDLDRNYWYQIQEMVTQTKNQTVDVKDWPPMGTRDLSGHDHKRLFMQVHPRPGDKAAQEPRFRDMADAAGIRETYNGRGVAVADFNLDGALDMYVANQGGPSCYYVNTSFQGKASPEFLRLLLVGRPDLGVKVGGRVLASTANAVGARVTLHSRTGLQMREVQGGMGFASQSEYALHFGVPDPKAVERITIQWPSSRVQKITGEKARALMNHHVRLVEGGEAELLKSEGRNPKAETNPKSEKF